MDPADHHAEPPKASPQRPQLGAAATSGAVVSQPARVGGSEAGCPAVADDQVLATGQVTGGKGAAHLDESADRLPPIARPDNKVARRNGK
ncbi:hypothetical protein [Pedococcus sp. 5OH_020]|uniref:hypothetical protein n=1 Tax=Pedococcus sp. 5OH_020 TaxID=2989814 RepID=UPI0022E9F4E3|nr:hypothetical protein [Pedococcus sp. 5OH_020]